MKIYMNQLPNKNLKNIKNLFMTLTKENHKTIITKNNMKINMRTNMMINMKKIPNKYYKFIYYLLNLDRASLIGLFIYGDLKFV